MNVRHVLLIPVAGLASCPMAEVTPRIPEASRSSSRSSSMRRPLGPIGDIPPAEFGAQYYAQAAVV